MSIPTITHEEWLAAVGKATILEDDPNAVTMIEFAKILNVHPATARRQMRKLLDTGKAEMVFKSCRLDDGQTRRLPAYRLKK